MWGADACHVTQEVKDEIYALCGYLGNDGAHC